MGFDCLSGNKLGKKYRKKQEFKETLASGSSQQQADEFGDLLFSMVNMGRFFDLNAEDSLRLTNAKFEQRFRYIEQQAEKEQRALTDLSLDEMDKHWEAAKKAP